jgi:TonB family protein
MTSVSGNVSNYHLGYRVVSRLTFFAAYLRLMMGQAATASPTKQFDAELSQALIGTWELKSEKYLPVDRVFDSFDGRGHFKAINILRFAARKGRQEDEGKWQVSNSELIVEVTKLPSGQWSGLFGKLKIVSLHEDLMVLRTLAGHRQEWRKVSLPTQLPPTFREGEVNRAIALATPKPEYPTSARYQRLQGKGIFGVMVDENTGFVTAVRIFQSTKYEILDTAAIQALQKWRFRPHTVVKIRVPINFSLRMFHPR